MALEGRRCAQHFLSLKYTSHLPVLKLLPSKQRHCYIYNFLFVGGICSVDELLLDRFIRHHAEQHISSKKHSKLLLIVMFTILYMFTILGVRRIMS